MKKIVITFLLFFVFYSTQFAQLDLSVFTDKNEYQYGENIQLICKVTNRADTVFSYLFGSTGSCQAEFSFNDFNSWEHTACLETTEMLTFKPNGSILYVWKIVPEVYGLPDRDGLQKITGKYYFNLNDTLFINAPMYLGGQLSVRYLAAYSDSVNMIKDSLNVEVLDSTGIDNFITEHWQVNGYSIDSVIANFGNDSLFDYIERAVFVQYSKRIFENALEYFPLHTGDKWIYNVRRDEAWTYGILHYTLTRKVTGDTTMQNGLRYFVIKETSGDTSLVRTFYERLDTTNAKVYAYLPHEEKEYMEYNLNPRRENVFTGWQNFGLYGAEYIDEELQLKNLRIAGLFKNDTTQFPSMYFESNPANSVSGTSFELTKDIGITLRKKDYLDAYIMYDTLKAAYINGKYYGDSTLVDVKNDLNNPLDFALFQNYPNPFNPATIIRYTISKVETLHATSQRATSQRATSQQIVQLRVYDILGREIRTLVNKKQAPGNYEVTFNAENLPSGIYFYRLKYGNYIQVKKMILLR